MTHYEILGVTPDADQSLIRKAWLAQAKQFHPDINKSADAKERYLKVQQAYEVLSDVDQRAAYDLSLFSPHSQAQNGQAGNPAFNEAIRNAQRSGVFADSPAEFDGPSLGEVVSGLVDGVAAGYIGRNPLLRAAYRRVRGEIHDSIRKVLKENRSQAQRRRTA